MAEGGHKSKDRVGSGKLLIVGLGNPGRSTIRRATTSASWESMRSRGDTGSISRSKFNAIYGTGVLPGDQQQVVCLKPQTYMNLSGQSVSRALGFFDLDVESMIVLHDDIDLDFGTLRLKRGGGHGGHNGLRSIDQLLGSRDYFRVRMGVGRPGRGAKGPVKDYVLHRFDAEQAPHLEDFLERASDAVVTLVEEGLKQAQSRFNGPLPALVSSRASADKA